MRQAETRTPWLKATQRNRRGSQPLRIVGTADSLQNIGNKSLPGLGRRASNRNPRCGIKPRALPMNLDQPVGTFKFWEVVDHWARERLEHELVVARSLAHGVIVDGLRIHSVDPKWLNAGDPPGGYPYVGYSAQGGAPVLLRAEVLEHLLVVARGAAEPSRRILADEYLSREDLAAWLIQTDQRLPAFWYGELDNPACS